MKIKLSSNDVENGMKSVGGNHKYQVYLIICFIFVKIVTDSFYCPLPYFLTDPKISCLDKSTNLYTIKCKLKDICLINNSKEENDKIKFMLIEPEKITFINEFELMCQDMKIGILAASASIGNLLGNIIAPFMTDNLGRINTIVIIALSDVFIKSLIFIYKDLNFLIVILTLINCTNNIIYTSSSLYINEMVDSEKRGTYICWFNSFFGMSGIIYTIIFNFTNSWKSLHLFSIFCSIMSFILVKLCLDESIRFLYMKNKSDQIFEVFERMAKINKREKEYEIWYNCLQIDEMKESSIAKTKLDIGENNNLCIPVNLIFKNKQDTYNFVAFSFISLVTVSGLIYNAVDMKHTEDTLLHPILFYSADFILILICGFMIDSPSIGRKIPCIIFSLICFIFYIVKYITQHFFKHSSIDENIFIIDFMIRFGVSISFNILIEYNFEIYSTDIRSTAFNLNKLFSRLGDFITPIIMSVNYGLTTLIIGVLYGVMTLFILYLKETRGEPLRENVGEDKENSVDTSKLFFMDKTRISKKYKKFNKSHVILRQMSNDISKDEEEAHCSLLLKR